MELLISAGTMTHDPASTGREGGRDGKNREVCQRKWKGNPDISFEIQVVSQFSMQDLFDF